jgi:cysteine desulfurase
VIYLDNNATTRPSSGVRAACAEMLEETWGNPSSLHRVGQAARRRVELARRSVAELVGASPREIIFVCGGTESIDLAIRGSLAARRDRAKRTIITTAIEHAAVGKLAAALCEQEAPFELKLAPLVDGGVVDPEALAQEIDETVALVSVQWANNETGAIQPVESIGELCRERGVVFHCDGTQWVGKAPTDVKSFPVDLLTFSAHKFHGPKGAGALYVRRGVRHAPTVHGSQELGRRGGTENSAGIVGMGVAAEEAREWMSDPARAERMEALRDRFEELVCARVEGASVNRPEPPHRRLWNTANIAFAKLEAEALLMLLSEQGLCASAGSACASGSLEGSPVLLAMGVPERLAHGSIRFSLSRETTEAELDGAVEIIEASVARLRGSSSAALR